MELNIDSALSVYHLTERVRKRSALLNHRRTMNIVSYEIENATILDGAHTRIFASFQVMSRFLPQVARYRRLAANAESIFVFGIPDAETPPIPNVTYIPLRPGDQLAREWFIVSYGREYATMLSTVEQSQLTDPDAKRIFSGLWTFDPSLTAIIADWLTSVVNTSPFDFAEAEHRQDRQAAYVRQIASRLGARLERPAKSPLEDESRSELRAMAYQALPQAIWSGAFSRS